MAIGVIDCAGLAAAIVALPAADKASICNALNCAPTQAAVTTALSGLAGATVPGNVLTITGTAPNLAIAFAPASVAATTSAGVAAAVASMTPAELAAMCSKLNCAPTPAALTAALMALSGSSTAGNVLTIVAGAPVWQALPTAAADTTPIL